jgi:hypothetical protein
VDSVVVVIAVVVSCSPSRGETISRIVEKSAAIRRAR